MHRDYQGSILAITNATGSIVEKRHFDPWGSIVKVQDGAGNNLTKLTFFDRGYTGHEHLESVRLIHMNARLYDQNYTVSYKRIMYYKTQIIHKITTVMGIVLTTH